MKMKFKSWYSVAPTFAEVLLATKHTSMDRRNYVRSSTHRAEAEGIEEDDEELEDGFGDEDDGEKTIIIDSKIRWCWRIFIIIIIIIATISRYKNNTGQKTTPGSWFRWRGLCGDTSHPTVFDTRKATGMKGEHPLRIGDTTPNIRDMLLKTSQNVAYLLIHLYKITVSKCREA